MSINNRIKILTEELEKLEREKELLEKKNKSDKLDAETIELAELLHEKLCRHNHIDGCGWFYRSWNDNPLSLSRQSYYNKASKLIALIKHYIADNPDDRKQFVESLVNTIK